ncbi:hypothetical protein HanIR_Chr12g0569591 [Helianthus annuus]|nr:hypothetical protein HanIR_Chr12g0569591 [Helianthus annuus]
MLSCRSGRMQRDLTRLVVPPLVGPMGLPCFERLYRVQGTLRRQQLHTNMIRCMTMMFYQDIIECRIK